MLEGNRGLLFTNEGPEVVTEWFESFKKNDFARTGNKVDEGFELPAGAFTSISVTLIFSPPFPSLFPFSSFLFLVLPLSLFPSPFSRLASILMQTLPTGPIHINDDPAPHSLEPQFRKLGMSTSLLKGVPTLNNPHVVCKKGDTLNPNQVNLLKLFGKTFATVRFLPTPSLLLFPNSHFRFLQFQIVPLLGVHLTDGSVIHGTEGEAIAADEE